MKLLFLVQADHGTTAFDRLYNAIAKNVEHCDLRWMSSSEQANLKRYFKSIDTSVYDRILFFIRFKKELKQIKFIQTVPNLVILEYDAFQNYINGKYKGKFSRYYRHFPWSRVISSGAMVTKKLKSEGVDASFVSKGYDGDFLCNMHQTRNIELAFVGSIKHSTYSQRKFFLESLQRHEQVLIKKTNTFEEYKELLNCIRFFISADIGFGEYMQKNFEAIACGCVLFAWNQGKEENQALGFKDMENIVLYSSVEELLSKLDLLRNDQLLADKIADNGQKHAEAYFTFEHIGKKIAQEIKLPLRKKVVKRYFGIRRYSWSFPEHTT